MVAVLCRGEGWAMWRGVRARLASWCGLGLRCRTLLPVVFAGWVGLDAAEVVVAWLIAATCYAEPVVPRHEVRLRCGRARVG